MAAPARTWRDTFPGYSKENLKTYIRFIMASSATIATWTGMEWTLVMFLPQVLWRVGAILLV